MDLEYRLLEDVAAKMSSQSRSSGHESGIPRRWSILWEGEERLPERDTLFRSPVRCPGGWAVIVAWFVLFWCGCQRPEPHTGPPPKLDRFAGIALGESPASATEKMLEKPGVIFESDTADVVFRGGEILGAQVDRWVLSFWQGEHFWFMQIHLAVDTSESERVFHSIREALVAQYGVPSTEGIHGIGRTTGAVWREFPEGSELPNSLSVMLPGDRAGVTLWYGGHAYTKSLEAESR